MAKLNPKMTDHFAPEVAEREVEFDAIARQAYEEVEALHKLMDNAMTMLANTAVPVGPITDDISTVQRLHAFRRSLAAAPERPRILFVDDEHPNLVSFRLAFAERFEVLIANNSSDALSILDGTPVDAVITDERMPGATGVELCELVHGRFPGLRCVLVTGYGDERVLSAAINRGRVWRYLRKPWRDGEMEDAIRCAVKETLRCRAELRNTAYVL